jgi:hypothetical protein
VAPSSHQFQLRIPLDLHETLVRAAEREERSLHREIIFRLRKSFVGEVVSAETRAKAATADTPESVAVKAQTARAAIDLARTRLGSPREEADAALSSEEVESPAPATEDPIPSLPDTERRERHTRCRKSALHHIYHGSKPCPDCGYPR